ncbi:ribbon-helix-helix protein, CopG family [Micromonospora chalcea]|uniref:ribbon-helix-helix protein, CopG family n=1 Tax=Micromonospora chalcea TaxID=1874 RepID=UPI0021A3DDA6|nr:ribbon-helix-helix protein, CopG family [Micromonospora chalcea]MCT2279890.1 ribbon-helix-helix protein, CopG family [Micromonospora chalcea]
MAKEVEGAGGPVRLSINLSAEAAEAIRAITARRGITITEAIRRAISTHKYVDDAAERGAKILVEEPDSTVRELIFVL